MTRPPTDFGDAETPVQEEAAPIAIPTEENTVTLLGPDERPISASTETETPPNGEDKVRDGGVVDVRTTTTGHLIYNLLQCVNALTANEFQLAQIQAALAQQRMVVAPAPLARAIEQAKAVIIEQTHVRNVIVLELDRRFEGFDRAYWARIGIEVVVPHLPRDHAPPHDTDLSMDPIEERDE